MSNYEISILLKIPESKVKCMRYEAELKYGLYNEATYSICLLFWVLRD